MARVSEQTVGKRVSKHQFKGSVPCGWMFRGVIRVGGIRHPFVSRYNVQITFVKRMVSSRRYFHRHFPFWFERLIHLATFTLLHILSYVPPHVWPCVPRFNSPIRFVHAPMPSHWCIMEFIQNLLFGLLIQLRTVLSFGGNAAYSTQSFGSCRPSLCR